MGGECILGNNTQTLASEGVEAGATLHISIARKTVEQKVHPVYAATEVASVECRERESERRRKDRRSGEYRQRKPRKRGNDGKERESSTESSIGLTGISSNRSFGTPLSTRCIVRRRGAKKSKRKNGGGKRKNGGGNRICGAGSKRMMQQELGL